MFKLLANMAHILAVYELQSETLDHKVKGHVRPLPDGAVEDLVLGVV